MNEALPLLRDVLIFSIHSEKELLNYSRCKLSASLLFDLLKRINSVIKKCNTNEKKKELNCIYYK